MEDWSDAELRKKLSARQYEVLSLVAQRFSSKEIGRQLGLSYKTVDNHVADILERLELPTRADAGRMFLGLERGRERLPKVAETLDDPIRNEPIFGQPVGTYPDAGDDQRDEHDADDHAKARSPFIRFLIPPPVGGRRHDMTWEQRLGTVGRISVLALLFVASTVIIISRLLDLFNR